MKTVKELYEEIIQESDAKMKDKVTKLLIKWGNSKDDVEKMVAQEFAGALTAYPDSPAKKYAEYIRTNY